MAIYNTIFDLMLNKWIQFNNKDLPTGKIISITTAWIDYLNTYQLTIRVEDVNKEIHNIRINLENDSEDYYIKLLRGSIGKMSDSYNELLVSH
ncbi:hypothetical protein [Flammeovirga kamogawensis]|uniref:DUF3630 family protein n=1 Tax=Flammeovirga kamogawensis TaxID=373891 RepID=A0ABX8GVB2_9BACT|nr:hypothetical protein [Flammeovirga kamogawensis]MBB6461542.1 hypothetical protein [Flammeovirga kamogawensis]QWG07525.1 hypothetical protein KM029_00900 [Flammeovirga kamogawensis]TRX69339.1 hypothetical protein EO216_14845 [Flammeovirga kamogawensis]